MNTAYVSIGSNMDREANVRRVMKELRRRFGDVQASGVYESASVGFDGPAFFNLVAGFATDLEPSDLVAQLRDIEDLCGRDRTRPRFSSRPMDIDLLLLGDRQGDFGRTRIPRDEILHAPFVLVPLVDLIPDRCHPIARSSYRELLAKMSLGEADIWQVDLRA